MTNNYYGVDAFTSDKQSVFNNEKIIVTDKKIDLRLFSDCPYFMGEESSGVWYRYLKNPKPHGHFVDKRYVRWIKRKHQRLLKSEVGSTSGFFVMLQLMGIYSAWFLGAGSLLLTFYLWWQVPLKSLLQEYLESDFLWAVGLPYLLAQIGNWGAAYYDDECGLIFDRTTGKVTRVIPNGRITHTYDFKDFKGGLSTFINTGGQKEQSAFATHKETGQSVMIAQGLVGGAIAWSYLVRFMDITKPLPDIPEHETTRHLDPITKAHDEKIGRDPNFWAKQDPKAVSKLEFEEYKKAQAWVDERKALLNERGIDDLDFLNTLINP